VTGLADHVAGVVRVQVAQVGTGQQLGLPVEVMFLWRHKDKAAFPGETGRLVVAPTAHR